MMETRSLGKTYNIPPQPPAMDHTRVFPAGAVTFGVEYRDLDPDMLRATYADNAAYLAELEDRSPDGGFFDSGVSIHVCGTDDGYEYVRFDVFAEEPHYHYVHRRDDGEIENQVIDYDATANGDMLPWAIERLRTRLPEMLRAAGGSDVADALDLRLLDFVIDVVAQAAEDVRRARA